MLRNNQQAKLKALGILHTNPKNIDVICNKIKHMTTNHKTDELYRDV